MTVLSKLRASRVVPLGSKHLSEPRAHEAVNPV